VRTMQIEMAQNETDDRRVQLERQLTDLRGLLEKSREWIGLDDRHFRDALSASLETMGASISVHIVAFAPAPEEFCQGGMGEVA